MRPPYPVEIVPLIPEFLGRRRVKFTYPLRLVDELGIDGPALRFVVNGVALQPDEGGRLVDIFNPYATKFDQWAAPAAAARGADLVEEVGGKFRITPKGRELATRVRREADSYLATLEPVPPADTRRLAELLGLALDAIVASGVPHDHITRIARFRGDARVPMVALENAVFGLWQARDDCHMASWREAGFSGPSFDVLTRVWRREAGSEEELASKLPQQEPREVRDALAGLRRDGLVEPGALAATARGDAERRAIEDETDRRFFEPWPDDVGGEAPWIRERLAAVNAALAPTP